MNGTLLEFTKDMNQIFPLPSTDSVGEKRASNPVSKARGRKSKIPAKETLMNSFGLDLNTNAQSDKDEREPEQTIGFDDDTSSQIGLMESDLTSEVERKRALPNFGSAKLEQLPREPIDRNGKYMKCDPASQYSDSNLCFKKA